MHNFRSLYTVSVVIETKVVIGWFKLQLEMLLVDLNYNFECDWFVELSNNKLSDNKLASELVGNRIFQDTFISSLNWGEPLESSK